ncbi:malate synthase A [Shewanella surugensis]|uniref:malate synthase n=1 Tax=Shewanella surugensis TaxID=212020 RepID=A0ABT0LBS1_9GAMM|nr:malate synthase A [Shewanella surugensis]MCL1125019.1 malate synthase A [Shewanella surugensis]
MAINTIDKITTASSLVIKGSHQDRIVAEQSDVLMPGTFSLIEKVCENFADEVAHLLKARAQKQLSIDKGELPHFLPDTQKVRGSDWRIASIPHDLLDRRVELAGPVDRKRVINGLNANAKVFMADFEDALTPSWQQLISGQENLRDAINGDMDYTCPETNQYYQLKADSAVLMCRVRGLHMSEMHMAFKGEAIPAAFFDFCVYFHNNYLKLLEKGTAPYFYIPKLESHLEARLWAKIFSFVEERYCLRPGTIKCTCLIETLPAVFEMDEILYELRSNIVALNCGRWDYIFSYIKTLKNHKDRILPDRQAVTMDASLMSAYSRLLVKTCHKRGAMAIGGMAACIPSEMAADNEKILTQVFNDKQVEAHHGHDGTWVAHEGLIDVSIAAFEQYIGENHANQLHVTRDVDAPISAKELLMPCQGERTEAGIRLNLHIALQYIQAWINGQASVPIYGLMEDAATAEIARTSIWQWIKHQVSLSNGQIVTKLLVKSMLIEELAKVKQEVGVNEFTHGRYTEAAVLLENMVLADELIGFLTEPASNLLIA